ncbi:uncharacterized protein LOC117502613 isoform X1 [Thalassophryne amazonica]|uniref:uncharacterized protein LOC117502613 isoform X1 n=1 Tax=Thalassophryne amazonica TaxID=390379 RepID=UPI001471C2DC|nr:uncharacterized protein LOC117502613 isoform X1 [Thalassophryne amazonica]XP_034017560.1 uncharacterized protein LOC117502613 isoform X1 [Thalassophryne amazonica]
MNRAAGLLESGLDPVASLCLPADRVLDSGAVVCPGGFDRHGCPLAVFPVDGHTKLSSHLSKAEAVDFIHYCLHLYSQKREEDSLVSVVADLRNASPQTTSFVGETLCLLQLRRMTVHTAYIVQPKKRECVKLVLRLLSSESFKRVVVKDVAELSVYIDRSQLPASLGGYLVYSHRSWVDFMKEIDDFVQEFLSVVQRLPACISTLQALSMCPLPTNQTELHHFCYTNEAKVLQLRRELGLDELLRRCETVMEKLRFPEKEPCYQAMAGTALFTRTASDMLLNHSRITAAVEKVDYLLQQVFSKAHLQLRVFQLREDALQITEQVEKLLEKLAASPVEIAEDAPHAEILVLEYEASFITPAMALVSCAEDVIHTLEEILSLDSQASERWVLDVEKLKDELHAAVEVNLQTLRAVCSYHRCYGKARSWYTLILSENFLQQLLSNVNGNVAQTQSYWRTVPVWRQKLTAFLTKNPPPEVEELVHLTHLSNLIPDGRVQQAGKQMSERCMTLRKLLVSVGPVTTDAVQLALQWQHEFLQSNHWSVSSDPGSGEDALDSPGGACPPSTKTASRSETHTRDDAGGPLGKETVGPVGSTPSSAAPGLVLTRGKPSSLSSFDSGVDGVGGGQLELGESLSGLFRTTRPPQFHQRNLSSVCDSGEYRGVFGLGSRPSTQVLPKASMESLNLEVKVTRLVDLPSNPWLSLPVDDLENSYTVTITPNPPPHRDSSGSNSNSLWSNRSHSQPTQTAGLSTSQSRGPSTWEWILQSQSSFEDPELSPVCNILSSSSTDTRDRFTCSTEGSPTSLWDSHHLHKQSPDSVDGVILQKDWDIKEQQSLQEVEKILEKTNEILEEEENVLAQEVMLDALMRSECHQKERAFWVREDQPSRMSSHDLAEVGVLGLEDLVPAESETLCVRGAAGSEGEVYDSKGCAKGASEVVGTQEPLPEQKEVHLKDQPNMEKNDQ